MVDGAFIGWPRQSGKTMGPRHSLFRRFFGQQAFLAGILFVAFFPSLSFLGHWGDIFEGSLGPDMSIPRYSGAVMFDLTAERAATQAEETEHAQHCHTDLGSCSGQPVPAGFGLFVMREVLVRPPAVALAFVLADAQHALPSPAAAPLTPPPRNA